MKSINLKDKLINFTCFQCYYNLNIDMYSFERRRKHKWAMVYKWDFCQICMQLIFWKNSTLFHIFDRDLMLALFDFFYFRLKFFNWIQNQCPFRQRIILTAMNTRARNRPLLTTPRLRSPQRRSRLRCHRSVCLLILMRNRFWLTLTDLLSLVLTTVS
jgi:hypothetical protein